MKKLFKLIGIIMIAIITLSMSMSCAHKREPNKVNKDVTLQQLLTDRDSATMKAFDDSIYYHLPDVVFASVVYDVITKYHPQSVDDITHKIIADTYISNKVLYDGIYRGYLLRKNNNSLNKLIDEKVDSTNNNTKQNGDTSNCDR